MKVKSIRGREGKKSWKNFLFVEIKTEINDSGKGELERLTYFKNHIKTVGEGTPLCITHSSSASFWAGC